MVYIIQGQKYTHKRHLNQLKKRHEMDSNNTQDEMEEPLSIDPKTEEILMERHNSFESKRLGRGYQGVPCRWTHPHVTYTG